MPKPPKWTPKHVEIIASLISLAIAVLSVLLLILEKAPKLVSFVRAVDAALSWQVNVWFAAATEILPAVAISCLCWRAQRSAKLQPARIRADTMPLLAATYH